MGLNTCELRFDGIKIAFFSKNYKKSPNGWGRGPQTPKAFGDWGPRPQTSVCDTFEYNSFLNSFPKLDTCTFQLLAYAPFRCKIRFKCQQATISDLPSYDIFVSQKLPLLKIFDDVIACDLWFRPLPIKNPKYAYELEIAKKLF